MREYCRQAELEKTAPKKHEGYQFVAKAVTLDKLLKANHHFWISLAQDFHPFLSTYQRNRPMVPFLASDLFFFFFLHLIFSEKHILITYIVITLLTIQRLILTLLTIRCSILTLLTIRRLILTLLTIRRLIPTLLTIQYNTIQYETIQYNTYTIYHAKLT